MPRSKQVPEKNAKAAVAGGTKVKALERKGPVGAGVKKPHRFRPGTRALMEIRRYQANGLENLFIPKANFKRLAKDICRDQLKKVGSALDMRWQKDAVLALQIGAERELMSVLFRANLCALHAKRVTLMPHDMKLVTKVAHADPRYEDVPGSVEINVRPETPEEKRKAERKARETLVRMERAKKGKAVERAAKAKASAAPALAPAPAPAPTPAPSSSSN